MRTKRRAGNVFLVSLLVIGQSAAALAEIEPTELTSTSVHHVLTKTPLAPTGNDLALVEVTPGSPTGGIVLGTGSVATLGGIGETNPVVAYSDAPASAALGIADIDGDGALDVIAGSADGGLNLLSAGDATPLLSLTQTPIDIEAIDVDNDQADELAILSSSTELLVVDPGEPSPITTHHVDLPDAADALITGDLITGARDEIVALGAASTIVVLEDNGHATSSPLAVGSGAFGGAVAHVDLDDHSDLVVADGNDFEVFYGDGQGGLTSGHVEHINGVLDVDVEIASETQWAEIVVTTADKILRLQPQVDGTWPGPEQVLGTADNVSSELADLNGDGVTDLVVLEDSGKAVTVLRTNRAPSMAAHEDPSVFQGQTVSIPATGTDPDGDPLTYEIHDAPEGSDFDPATGTFTWTPTDVGVRAIKLVTSDWYDHTSETITISVGERPHVGDVLIAQWKAAAITGEVTLKASVAPANSVTFEWARKGTDTWHKIGEDDTSIDGWSVPWQTGDKNGWFHIRARARLGDETSTDTIKVWVDNRAPRLRVQSRRAFSPNEDGRYDKLAIRARANELVHFKVAIVRDGRELRRWSWGSLRSRILVRWNGRVDGRKLRDGSYNVKVSARDRVNHARSETERTRIDTKAPSFRWRRVPHGVVTRTGPLGVRYRTNDPSGAVRLQMRVVQAGKTVAHRSVRMQRRRGRWSIKPRYGDGSPFVPGSYSVRARVADRVGNARWVSGRHWEYAPPRRGRAYMRLEGTGRQLALTFDDCNFGSAWQSILTTLKAHNVKATFFCNGSNVRQNAPSARRTVKEGHDVASHGYNHMVMSSLSSYTARSQIVRDRVAWMDVTGTAGVPYFRPPYGSYNAGTVSIAGSLGYSRVMIWDVDPQDWRTQSAFSTSSHVLSRAHSGSVVLMHVLPSTAAALPTILSRLKSRGLRPVTLTKLFRAAGYH